MRRQKISNNHNQSDKLLFDYEGMVKVFAKLCGHNEVVVSLNRDACIEFINEHAARRFQRKASELIGKSVWGILEPESAERRKAIFHQVLQSKKPVRFVDERKGLWLDSMVYPVFDKRRRIQKVLIMSRDITLQKMKEKEIERFNQELEQRVRERTAELEKTVEEQAKTANILAVQKKELEELNAALRILLQKREEDRKELEEHVMTNLRLLILPNLERLMEIPLEHQHKEMLKTLNTSLNGITSPFSRTLSSNYLQLTPKEIQLADLIRDGKTTKEIAKLFNKSIRTIDVHRDHIRKKLGIKDRKTNLRTYLLTLK